VALVTTVPFFLSLTQSSLHPDRSSLLWQLASIPSTPIASLTRFPSASATHADPFFKPFGIQPIFRAPRTQRGAILPFQQRSNRSHRQQPMLLRSSTRQRLPILLIQSFVPTATHVASIFHSATLADPVDRSPSILCFIGIHSS